jgi:hypothetical protein
MEEGTREEVNMAKAKFDTSFDFGFNVKGAKARKSGSKAKGKKPRKARAKKAGGSRKGKPKGGGS